MKWVALPAMLAALLVGATAVPAPVGRPVGIRGVTVGPIESALHPGKGYGSPACARTMAELARMGATWASVTPYGRVADLSPTGIDWTFETPYAHNRAAVAAAVRQAHDNGLKVLLVPHLWVENGEWRGHIDPGSEAGWQRWTRAYAAFVLGWAQLANEAGADMLSVGVELRSWASSFRVASLLALIAEVRKVYSGPLTYSANWDDVEDTVVFSALDYVGMNAFYPLAEKEGAGFAELYEGGRKVASRVRKLADKWHRPVLFTEVGYTTRRDPAVKPWEWPDTMSHVVVDQVAQADAYRAILAPVIDEPSFAGFFVWRVYADPDDVSQESEWGFSPRGKLAELVMRDAFSTRWAVDGPRLPGAAFGSHAALVPGVY